MKKRIFGGVIVVVILLIIISLISLLNRSTQGIPHGIYFQIDNQGNMVKEGSESGWIIRKDEAEHRYLIFSIVNIDGTIYFEIEREQVGSSSEAESGLFRYEAKYDEKTKMLTVIMPSSYGKPHYIPTNEFEMEAFQFKKTGISIG